MNAPTPLAHARMWRNLSLEQVASLTGATVADILGVELGDVTHLSPHTDLAALLRAYANVVGLDPDTVVHNHLAALIGDRGHGGHGLRDDGGSEPRTAPSSLSSPDALRQFPSERRGARLTSTSAGSPLRESFRLQQADDAGARTRDNVRANHLYASAALATIVVLSIALAFHGTPRTDLRGAVSKGAPVARPLSPLPVESTGSDSGTRVRLDKHASESRARQHRDLPSPPPSQAAGSAVSLPRDPGIAAAAGEPLDGWWDMTNRVQSSSYAAYRRLRLGYRLQLQQDGDRVTGQGQKWSENGRRIPGATRTPISVDGVIKGRRVSLTFVERGHRRDSGGSFELLLTRAGRLAGTFESDAAQSRGSSVASRLSSLPVAQ